MFKWRNTKWWHTTKAIEIEKDPYNHTKVVTHVELAQSTGASGWLLNGMAKKNGPVTAQIARLLKIREISSPLRCVVSNTQQCTGPELGKKKEQVEGKEPRILGPSDKSIHGHYALGKIQRENWSHSKNVTLVVEEKDRISHLAD